MPFTLTATPSCARAEARATRARDSTNDGADAATDTQLKRCSSAQEKWCRRCFVLRVAASVRRAFSLGRHLPAVAISARPRPASGSRAAQNQKSPLPPHAPRHGPFGFALRPPPRGASRPPARAARRRARWPGRCSRGTLRGRRARAGTLRARGASRERAAASRASSLVSHVASLRRRRATRPEFVPRAPDVQISRALAGPGCVL